MSKSDTSYLFEDKKKYKEVERGNEVFHFYNQFLKKQMKKDKQNEKNKQTEKR